MRALILEKKRVNLVDINDVKDLYMLLKTTKNEDPYYNDFELFYSVNFVYNDGILGTHSFINKFAKKLTHEVYKNICAVVKYDEDFNIIDLTDDDIFILERILQVEIIF